MGYFRAKVPLVAAILFVGSCSLLLLSSTSAYPRHIFLSDMKQFSWWRGQETRPESPNRNGPYPGANSQNGNKQSGKFNTRDFFSSLSNLWPRRVVPQRQTQQLNRNNIPPSWTSNTNSNGPQSWTSSGNIPQLQPQPQQYIPPPASLLSAKSKSTTKPSIKSSSTERPPKQSRDSLKPKDKPQVKRPNKVQNKNTTVKTKTKTKKYGIRRNKNKKIQKKPLNKRTTTTTTTSQPKSKLRTEIYY